MQAWEMGLRIKSTLPIESDGQQQTDLAPFWCVRTALPLSLLLRCRRTWRAGCCTAWARTTALCPPSTPSQSRATGTARARTRTSGEEFLLGWFKAICAAWVGLDGALHLGDGAEGLVGRGLGCVLVLRCTAWRGNLGSDLSGWTWL
jgi:hypothetical protein